MEKSTIPVDDGSGQTCEVAAFRVHTLVIGSGAAGLNTAVQLHARGMEDVLIVTEGLQMGTSINTGSDKQTYYKLGMCGAEDDSPEALAESFFAGGSMHGDLAMVEASLSARCFLNLVNLGVPFPTDRFGQFVGYKTDHDPRQRATSVGPYTSREMCRSLIREIERRGITVHEGRVVVKLLTHGAGREKRAVGAVAVRCDDESAKPSDVQAILAVYTAENVVFATGGPGGLYKTSVYPTVHTGGIGLALAEGAQAQSLPESQYGLASTEFRWNVSGTYMQVVPRFVSTGPDGTSDAQEFLRPYFKTAGEMNSAVFLKGYQWPFDSRKIAGGSSIVDILVYIETVMKQRRAFLDFRANPAEFGFDTLSVEAREYLTRSEALLDSPIARLTKMNPAAIELYRDHGIDITRAPLEIAVCAQHNNGGLAANLWWQSNNIAHLFPVGEVNGSHGVYRPGGSALNSGQVAGFRAAEYMARRCRDWTVPDAACRQAATDGVQALLAWIAKCGGATADWRKERAEFQARMTRAGAHIRAPRELARAVSEAWAQWNRLETGGSAAANVVELAEALRNRQLCFAHAVYLEAVKFAVQSGVGSRGSAMVLDETGTPAHESLGQEWNFAPENPEFRDKVLVTAAEPDGRVRNEWVPRRPLPKTDAWFETAWAAFREGKIYE
ncbi:MAG: FAD-binding protein [Kiritimatiellae bacterium]|nr:FAD-binding protein [Kiritimatiellia bacterium]